jgi:hypothetical protein
LIPLDRRDIMLLSSLNQIESRRYEVVGSLLHFLTQSVRY